MAARIAVLGWIHMDLVVRAARLPEAGDTVIGEELFVVPGGKGANRAVAAARLGGEVDLIGRAGDDGWGRELRTVLSAEGVGLSRVAVSKEDPTGASLVTLLPDGRSATMVAHGANSGLKREDVGAAAELVAAADVFVCHLGLPEEVSAEALSLARRAGTRTLLHAEPRQELSPEQLDEVDVLIASERGGARLLGQEDDDLAPRSLARRLHALGVGRVVVWQADGGGLSFDGETFLEERGIARERIDTTAAASAFAAALAVAIGEEQRAADGLRFACAAAALAAATEGALPSLPTREAVSALIEGERPDKG